LRPTPAGNHQVEATAEHPPDEEPAEAPVTVAEGVDRLELGVYERGGGDGIMFRAVRIVDEVPHEDLDSVGRSGDVRSQVWCRGTDPTEAFSPRALELIIEIRERHQDPVPTPQSLEGEQPVVRQRSIDTLQPGHGPTGPHRRRRQAPPER
jgi:hypothetical protein